MLLILTVILKVAATVLLPLINSKIQDLAIHLYLTLKAVSIDFDTTQQTTQIILQPKCTPTSYQIQFVFQGKTMTFMHPVDKYCVFYIVEVLFETNRCIVSIKNTECNTLSYVLVRLLHISIADQKLPLTMVHYQ